MQILKQGAEAILYFDSFEGRKVLVKERIKKYYRISQLDETLRKTRTKKELTLLREARRFGVQTPQVINVEESGHKIIMEFVEGRLVKDFLNFASRRDVEEICFKIGESIGKLHSGGIIHGDLTTSNMIIKGGNIFFIDFGLGDFSKKIEDQGVDLNLLQEALKSTHYKILNLCWENIVKGYKKEYKDANKVLKKVEEIEARARYAERQR